MSKRNDNFFEEKKAWSFTKDRILGRYLKAYFQKIIMLGKPICYVDCFAGKGKFNDGNDGSPFIALKIIDETIQHSTVNPNVYTYFIELNHYEDLENNTSSLYSELNNNHIYYKVIGGKFEDNIDYILNEHKESTLFLYIDPYGIKAIDVDKFNNFKLSSNKSVEMLINFNTWGFFREACRVLKVDFRLDSETNSYLIEYDPNNNLSRDELTKIAGGDYWIDIVSEYKNKCINASQKQKSKFANEAEIKLSLGIKNAFNRKFKYVLNVPIKSNEDSRVPKYRLFHLTNHVDGCILMGDNMLKNSEEASIEQRGGQLSFFEFSTEGLFVQSDIKEILLNNLSSSSIHLKDFIANIFINEGLIRSSSSIKSTLKELEVEGRIVVERFPSITKYGKKTTFMNEDKKQEVLIRRR